MVPLFFMGKISLREVNLIAAPAIISAVAEPLIALADSSIIKNYSAKPSTVIGSITLASSFFLLIVWIFSQTRTAMSTLVAKYNGARKLGHIKDLVPQMIWLNFGIGLIFCLLTKIFASGIFWFYDAKGEMLQICNDYFQIRAFGFPFTLATLLIFGIFRGMQNTFWPMVVTIIGAGINIGGDILLLRGVDGYISPQGVQGVAFASFLSQVIMFLLSAWLLMKKTPFGLSFRFTRHFEFMNLMGMSGNLIIRSIAVNAVYFFSNMFATGYGDHFIAVHGVCYQIWLFCAFFIEGYANAGNSLVGKFIGARDSESLRELSRLMMKNTLILAVLLSLILLLLYVPLGKLFLKEEVSLQLFYEVFWLIILMQPIISVAFVFDDLMKGAGKMVQLRNTLIFSSFCGFVPALFLLDSAGFKLFAIWIAFNIWMSIRAIVLRRVYLRSIHREYFRDETENRNANS